MRLPDLVLERLLEKAADIILSEGILPLDILTELESAGIIIDDFTETVLHYHLKDI